MAEKFIDSECISLCTALCFRKRVSHPTNVPSACSIAMAALGFERKPLPRENSADPHSRSRRLERDSNTS